MFDDLGKSLPEFKTNVFRDKEESKHPILSYKDIQMMESFLSFVPHIDKLDKHTFKEFVSLPIEYRRGIFDDLKAKKDSGMSAPDLLIRVRLLVNKSLDAIRLKPGRYVPELDPQAAEFRKEMNLQQNIIEKNAEERITSAEKTIKEDNNIKQRPRKAN